jgi:hypothetical protein
VTDIVQDTPLDAAAALQELSGSEQGGSAEDEEAADPAVAARRRLGGPVPALLYLAMVGAAIGGSLLGTLYAKVVLDAPSTVAPVAFAFVLEAIVAAWYGGKRFGRPLTNDQRARIAITYTLIVAVVLTPAFALGWMPGSKVLLDRLDGLSSGGVLAALGLSLLGLATIALARYLVLSAVSPLVSPLKKAKAGAGA